MGTRSAFCLLLLTLPGCLEAAAGKRASNELERAAFENALERVSRELSPRLAKARCMEQNPQRVTVPGWEGFPTVLCTYTEKRQRREASG